MNAITQALQTAGVKLPPLNKRIWLWLHDHPGKTSREVATALAVPHANAASTLGIMSKRKMVREELRPYGHKSVLQYTTLGKTFEVLPLPKKVARAAVVGVLPETPKPALIIVPPKAIDLDDMTVREARALYAHLHKMFGGVK